LYIPKAHLNHFIEDHFQSSGVWFNFRLIEFMDGCRDFWLEYEKPTDGIPNGARTENSIRRVLECLDLLIAKGVIRSPRLCSHGPCPKKAVSLAVIQFNNLRFSASLKRTGSTYSSFSMSESA